MDVSALTASVTSLCADRGYQQARDPFDFERQPAQMADAVCGVQAIRSGTIAELGPHQIEVYRIECWLARQTKQRSYDAINSMHTDLSAVEVGCFGAAAQFLVQDESQEHEVQLPVDEADYIVGLFACDVEIDRSWDGLAV
jgi:hypothetical protein